MQQYVKSFKKRGIHVHIQEEQNIDSFPKEINSPLFTAPSPAAAELKTHQNNIEITSPSNYYGTPDAYIEPPLHSPEEREAEPPEIIGSSFEGRYGRLNFANAYATIVGTTLGLLAILLLLKNTPIPQKVLLRIGGMIVLIGFGLSSRACGLRLRDMNISEWVYAPIFVIPFFMKLVLRINGLYTWLILIISFVLMLSIPGSSGENKYGLVSKRGSPVGLIILIGLTVIGGISLLALLVLD